MSGIKIAKYVVFLSIIFFGLFIFCNFGNALQILGQYITPSGQPVIVTDYDPSFMPPYYGPTPGGVTYINQFGGLSGYSPEFDTTRGPVPGDYITPWGVYPNWENRWLLGAAGMYGPGGLYLYGGYGGMYGQQPQYGIYGPTSWRNPEADLLASYGIPPIGFGLYSLGFGMGLPGSGGLGIYGPTSWRNPGADLLASYGIPPMGFGL